MKRRIVALAAPSVLPAYIAAYGGRSPSLRPGQPVTVAARNKLAPASLGDRRRAVILIAEPTDVRRQPPRRPFARQSPNDAKTVRLRLRVRIGLLLASRLAAPPRPAQGAVGSFRRGQRPSSLVDAAKSRLTPTASPRLTKSGP